MIDITIIGAGFCGSVTAIRLLRSSVTPTHIRLVEKDASQIGRGIAYRTREQSHLLNVPAGRMSAFPEKPDHFVDWAVRNKSRLGGQYESVAITHDSYLPRGAYGDYLVELLNDAINQESRHAVEVINDEVTSVEPQAGNDIHIRTRSGRRWRTRNCVLALGNAVPATPPGLNVDALPAGRYHGNPWAPDMLPAVQESGACLLLGSGLTTMDVVIALSDRGYRGTIHVISPRGFVPLAHGRAAAYPSSRNAELPPARLLETFSELRSMAINAVEDDLGWQTVIDSLRPRTAEIWQNLGVTGQRQFLRHVRPMWDHHRHRVAPQVRARFDELLTAGRLCVHHARVTALRTDDERPTAIRAIARERDGKIATWTVDHVINCTGPASLHRPGTPELIRRLVRAYPETADAHCMGLTVTTDMRLAMGPRHPTAQIFALGPPLRGQLWECTAVPECRQAVAAISNALLSDKR